MNKTIPVIAALVAVIALPAALCGCASMPPLTDADLTKRMEFNCTFDRLQVGEERRYYVEIRPAGSIDDAVFSSSNEAVATIDEQGVVTALAAGETTVAVRSEKTRKEASFELTVYDEIIFSDGAGEGDERLALAASSEQPASVAVCGRFSVPVSVNGILKIEAIGRTELCGARVFDGGSLSVEGAAFAAREGGICVEVGEGAEFSAVSCTFACDPSAEPATACLAARGFSSLTLDECDFAGFEKAVAIEPSDGEAHVFNNVFSRCAAAIEADVSLPDEGANAALGGEIVDNIFADCQKTFELIAFGNYEGGLKTDGD